MYFRLNVHLTDLHEHQIEVPDKKFKKTKLSNKLNNMDVIIDSSFV